MAVLDDCPTEILLGIISHVHRWRDLCSLSCVSSRLHQVVRLSPSLANSKLYRRLDFGDGGTLAVEEGPKRFRSLLYKTLVSFLNCPGLTSYVEIVHLEWNYEADNDYFDLPTDEAVYLLELIFRKTDILQLQRGKGFAHALRERKQEAYVALLLLLLGDLEVLRITLASDDKWVPWAVRKASLSYFFRSSLSSGLRSLREVEITWNSDHRWDIGISLYHIAPFFLLPSIDRIEAHKVDHEDEFDWEGTYGSSTVTQLSFLGCAINLEALEEVVSIPRALKSFSYSYVDEREWVHDADYDMDAMSRFRERIEKMLGDCQIQIAPDPSDNEVWI